MKICKIADYNIGFDGSMRFLQIIDYSWASDSKTFDFSFVLPPELDASRKMPDIEKKRFFVQRQIAEIIPNYNGFVFHSACFDVNGTGVAFSAQSGTGKTTQMLNWQKFLGDKMTVVNGDKPIVRFFDEDFCKEHNLNIPEGTELGVPYAYGTPWRGKECLGCDMRTPLKHICFIERSDTNYVTKPDKSEAITRIMKQVYIPSDPIALSNTLSLVNRLISSCDLWVIHCNMDPESAEVAYKAIFGK